MTLGLFLETVPSVQSIEVYNEFQELCYKGLSEGCNINPEKVVFTFFSLVEGVIYVYLDVDEEE